MRLRPNSQPQDASLSFVLPYPSSVRNEYSKNLLQTSHNARQKPVSKAPLWKQSSRDFIERSKIKTRAPGNGPHTDESLGRYSAWPAGTRSWYRELNNNVNGTQGGKAPRQTHRSMVIKKSMSTKSHNSLPCGKASLHRSMKDLRRPYTCAPGNGPHKDESLGGTSYRGTFGTRGWYKSINNNDNSREHGMRGGRKVVNAEWIYL